MPPTPTQSFLFHERSLLKMTSRLSVFAFNGTYNYNYSEGVHLDPIPLLANQDLLDVRYIPVGLAKQNCPAQLDIIFEALNESCEVVVFCGTDNIEELAYLFAINRLPGRRVFFVGSMYPFGHPLYDGKLSLDTLMRLRGLVEEGSWVVVGETVARGECVRKTHSVAHDAIQPPIHLDDKAELARPTLPMFCVKPSLLRARVPIIMSSLGDDGGWIDWGNIDGLVVAGGGTGSIPTVLRENILSARSGKRVVITTRCFAGPNHDDEMYPGSAQDYENDGFEVRQFNGLNPMQARLRLMLELAT